MFNADSRPSVASGCRLIPSLARLLNSTSAKSTLGRFLTLALSVDHGAQGSPNFDGWNFRHLFVDQQAREGQAPVVLPSTGADSFAATLLLFRQQAGFAHQR